MSIRSLRISFHKSKHLFVNLNWLVNLLSFPSDVDMDFHSGLQLFQSLNHGLVRYRYEPSNQPSLALPFPPFDQCLAALQFAGQLRQRLTLGLGFLAQRWFHQVLETMFDPRTRAPRSFRSLPAFTAISSRSLSSCSWKVVFEDPVRILINLGQTIWNPSFLFFGLEILKGHMLLKTPIPIWSTYIEWIRRIPTVSINRNHLKHTVPISISKMF